MTANFNQWIQSLPLTLNTHNYSALETTTFNQRIQSLPLTPNTWQQQCPRDNYFQPADPIFTFIPQHLTTTLRERQWLSISRFNLYFLAQTLHNYSALVTATFNQRIQSLPLTLNTHQYSTLETTNFNQQIQSLPLTPNTWQLQCPRNNYFQPVDSIFTFNPQHSQLQHPRDNYFQPADPIFTFDPQNLTTTVP